MIKIDNICKKFKDFEIKNISFEIKQGEYFVLLGPSGSGKTLFLELISGLLKPDSGKITGIDNKKIGFIYQDLMLFPHMNVYENISYGLRIKKIDKNEIEKEVNELSDKLNISHLLYKNVKKLSGGERQRVAIARAMIIKPDIYLFDEPTSSLDYNLKLKTRELFLSLYKQTKKTFIHVTHDFEEAISLSTKIGLIFNGQILQYGEPDYVFNNPNEKMVAEFLGYTNLYSGKIENNLMKINGIEIITPVANCEKAYIAIRSDEIILSEERIKSSARNVLKGRVKSILKRNSLIEVLIDAGVDFKVEITKRSFEEMKIKEGKQLWLTFKVSSIKVFKH